jgi:hypothetical protein
MGEGIRGFPNRVSTNPSRLVPRRVAAQQQLDGPYPPERMISWPVSPLVNKPRNNQPE